MTTGVTIIAVSLLLFAGSAGWGAAVVAILRTRGWESVEAELGAPLRIAIGLALSLAAAGLLVAVDLGYPVLLFAWEIAGCALLVASAVRSRHQWRVPGRARAVQLIIAIGVVAVLTAIALSRVANTPFSVFDDPTYTYLARRLVERGDLLDAFNQRRLVSYGGASAFQALFLDTGGTAALPAFDLMFSSLLIGLLVAGAAPRRGLWWWWAGSALLTGMLLVAGGVIGPGVRPFPTHNLSPAYSATALSLACFQLLARLTAAPVAKRRGICVLVGLLTAGILALRFTFVLPVAVATVLTIVVCLRKRGLGALALFAGSLLAGSVGWAVASWRSSRSPLFPLVLGNYDASYPGGNDPRIHSFRPYARIFWDLLGRGNLGWVLLLSGVVGVGCLIVRRGDRTPLVVLGAACIGSVVQLIVFTVTFSGADPNEIWRFAGPSVTACGLFALCVLGSAALSPDPEHPGAEAASATPKWPRRVPYGVVGVVAAVVLALTMLGWSFDIFVDDAPRRVTTGFELVGGGRGFRDRERILRPHYRAVNRALPDGAKVFSAVDYPGLLDLDRLRVATLDLPGSVSPPPHLPFFKGPAAKLDYLRELGFDYVVADGAIIPGLYERAAWDRNFWYRRSTPIPYRRWGRYVYDWLDDLGRITKHPNTRTIGNTYIVRL